MREDLENALETSQPPRGPDTLYSKPQTNCNLLVFSELLFYMLGGRYDLARSAEGTKRLFAPLPKLARQLIKSQGKYLEDEKKKAKSGNKYDQYWDMWYGKTPMSPNLVSGHGYYLWETLNFYRHGEQGRSELHFNRSHLQMVCTYVNTKHNRNGAQDVPLCACTIAYFWDEVVEKGPQYASDALSRPISYTHRFDRVHGGLTEYNLPRERFKQVKYLFIPTVPAREHAALLVISPLNKTVEHIDSDSELLPPAFPTKTYLPFTKASFKYF